MIRRRLIDNLFSRSVGRLAGLALASGLAIFSSLIQTVPARADAEHDAIVAAVRIASPNDPARRALDSAVAFVNLWPTFPFHPEWFHAPNATVADQMIYVLGTRRGGNLMYGGVAVLSFPGAADASQWASEVHGAGGSYTHGINPACTRIVGGRHVVAVHGMNFCWGPQARLSREILDILAQQAEQALAAVRTGGTSPSPPTSVSPPREQTEAPPRPDATLSGETAPPANENADATSDPSPPMSEETPSATDQATAEELTPAEIAAVSGLAGGAALLGSLMLAGVAGVRREDVIASIRDLLRGKSEDPFEAWKRKYDALGWKYSEKDGVATFDPVEGARNETGEIYSRERGGFVRDDSGGPPLVPATPRDGDVNQRGEVWSSFSGGFVGRETYERDMASRGALAEKDRQDLADMASRQNADVGETYERWQESKDAIAIRKIQVDEAHRVKAHVDSLLDRFEQDSRERGELDLNRLHLIQEMKKRASDLAFAPDPSGAAGKLRWLGGEAVGLRLRGFEQTYTYLDAAKDTALQMGALTADMLLTRGAATAGLASYAGTQASLAGGASAPEAIIQGVQQGIKSYGFLKGAEFLAGQAAQLPSVQKWIEKANQTEISLWPRGGAKPPQPGEPVWGGNMRAIQREIEERAAAKLPEGHPAREIGRINETLADAGPRYNARLIDPHVRLPANTPTYRAAVEALTKNEKLLTPEAKAAADAVRYDLKLRATERALEKVYEKNPELYGKITSLRNTGSHAQKGLNYRGLPSDIDFEPGHDGSVAGARAAELFEKEFDKSLREVSKEASAHGGQPGVEVGVENLKSNIYANNTGRGAFRSEGGLKIKEMMNQTSGTIEKIEGTQVKYRLNGGDPVEIGEGTRWSTGSARDIMSRDPVRLAEIKAADAKQLADFRADALNKYAEELGEMHTPAERLHQAQKLYNLGRRMETKGLEGRPLSVDTEIFDLARDAKSMSGAEQDDAAKTILEAIRSGR